MAKPGKNSDDYSENRNESDSNSTVIKKIREGDEKMLEYVYKKYRVDFLNFLTNNYEIRYYDGEDIFTEAIITLYELIQSGKIKGEVIFLKTYLYSIGKNKAREYHRKIRRFDDIETIRKEQSEKFEINFVDEIGNKDDSKILTIILNKLNVSFPKYSEVIELHYIQNLTIKEIAKILSIDESTVKLRINRARGVMQKTYLDIKDNYSNISRYKENKGQASKKLEKPNKEQLNKFRDEMSKRSPEFREKTEDSAQELELIALEHFRSRLAMKSYYIRTHKKKESEAILRAKMYEVEKEITDSPKEEDVKEFYSNEDILNINKRLKSIAGSNKPKQSKIKKNIYSYLNGFFSIITFGFHDFLLEDDAQVREHMNIEQSIIEDLKSIADDFSNSYQHQLNELIQKTNNLTDLKTK